MTAPAPGRSSGTLTIGFGMLSIECAVYAGIEDSKIKRSMRTPEGHEVGFATIDKATGELIPRTDTHLIYSCADGTEVPLNDDEIADALNQENGRCDLVGFYPLEQFDRYAHVNVMQLRPKKSKGKAQPFDKPFALLMRAMDERDVFALLKWTLRGNPAYGVLTSDGKLIQVRWADEVREALPMPTPEVSEAEVTMAGALVEALSDTQAPVLDNDAIEHVRAYAEAKATAMSKGDQLPKPEQAAPQPTVSDLMETLAASVAAAKGGKHVKVGV